MNESGKVVLERLREMVGRGPHQAEAVYYTAGTGLTRFAASRIHQNLERHEASVYIRVALDQKLGLSRTTDLSQPGLESALERALAIARLQKPNPWFKGFAPGAVDEITGSGESLPPARRLGLAHAILGEVATAGLQAAGSITSEAGFLSVVNSEGRLAHQPYSLAESVLVVMTGSDEPSASGYASWSGHDTADLDPVSLARVAGGKCIAGQARVDFQPGSVDVLLEPAAVSGLLDWLGYIGFGGKQFNEGTSFLAGRMGEQIMGAGVSIYDDHAEIPGLGLPHDFEGVPRQRVELVRDGVAAGVVHDRQSGARAGDHSTGHAPTPDSDLGPMPWNLAMAPGEATRDEMIASMDRGLIVTRFHYLNGLLETRKALFTGMTRDGTFLVEKGEVTGAVKNLRFTESMLDAFSRIAAIGRERQPVGTWAGRGATCTVPSILIRDFHFDSID